jgi:hypothetical protein
VLEHRLSSLRIATGATLASHSPVHIDVDQVKLIHVNALRISFR